MAKRCTEGASIPVVGPCKATCRHVLMADLGDISGDPQLGSSGGEGAVTYRGADGQRCWARFSDPKTTAIADLPA